MTVNGHPTRAAILLLGNEPQRFYPMAFTKAGRFKTAVTILDDREFGGTIFQQMDDGMAWVKDRLEARLVIGKPKASGSLVEREEVWQYPIPAIREALANAVCHRDYAIGVATTIRVYDKRLEIWNPGSLPSDLPPEALFREHVSHSRNRLIAECFFYTGIIERWGTGTLRIATALEEQRQPRPEFDVATQDVFKIIMFATGQTDKQLQDLGLNMRQIEAIHYLRVKGSISSSEYRVLSGASDATTKRDLSELVKKGLLLREGKGLSVTYSLVERS